MKTIQLSAVLLFCAIATSATGTNYWPKPAYYKYQVGATFGVNGISVGLADFPGSHWGIYTRMNQHTLGFKHEWDGQSHQSSGEALYYERTGFYYGWSASYRYIQWGPQIGIGLMEYNHPVYTNEPPRPAEEGTYGEIAINGLVNMRGCGFGCRVFLNINKFVPILGATLYLQTGWAWNENRKPTQAKMGASRTLPKF